MKILEILNIKKDVFKHAKNTHHCKINTCIKLHVAILSETYLEHLYIYLQKTENKFLYTYILLIVIGILAQKAFRLHSKFPDKPRILSVCFKSVNDKTKVMELAKKRKLVAKDLDPTWTESVVYFKEKLTYTYRNLFFKARTSAKQVIYKYIWFKNNTISAKKKRYFKANNYC